MTDHAVVVRDAVADDVAAMTALQNALLGTTTYEWRDEPHAVADRLAWFEAQQAAGDPVLVAEDQGRVIGFCAYGDFRDSRKWPGYRFTVEHTIHVAESHWGAGLGRRLLHELEGRARTAGKRVMVAAVDGSNTGSIAFHRRLGYVEVARMPGVGDKWGRRLDLVLLQHDLTAT